MDCRKLFSQKRKLKNLSNYLTKLLNIKNMTAQSILEKKGYNNFELIDIISEFDMQIREKYGLEDEPLHLWESYYIGDADEETVLETVTNKGFNNFDEIDDLFDIMDRDLLELANEYPTKQ